MATRAERATSVTPGWTPGQFLREVIDELRKVVWPTPDELYRYTLVVIFTVLIIAGFIGGVDAIVAKGAAKFIYNAG